MIHVQTSEGTDLPPAEQKRCARLLGSAAQAALRRAQAAQALDLSVVLTSDTAVQALNREFLGTDTPTDVLSFPSNETDPDSGLVYLGDVVISLPRALAQAQAGGHSLDDELQLLTVHGVLHLLGYDHGEPQDKEKMWALQAGVLAELGCRISGPALAE